MKLDKPVKGTTLFYTTSIKDRFLIAAKLIFYGRAVVYGECTSIDDKIIRQVNKQNKAIKTYKK